MASNEDVEETAPRGNEWEVVSLTASAYAAAPGTKQSDLNDEHKSSAEYEAETSDAMFMSGHFVFPPSQHENLPLEPENNEIQTEQVVKNEEFVTEGDSTAGMKFEENMKVKGFGLSGFPGIQIFDENGNILPISDAEFKEDTAPQLADKESILYSTAMPSSIHSEEHIVEESSASNCPLEHFQQGSSSGVSNKNKRDDDLPCQAWWKRQAASLVAHAKEANTFWSIFVAAAVMGLVIIGQQWQQERWQILQLKWQHGLLDERIGRMLGPLSRLKDIIVGGDRRGSFIKGSSTSSQH